MKRSLAGVLAVLALELTAPPADACGVKMVVKASPSSKAVARSATPSNLLLVGKPPHRLLRELSAAGHTVEVAATLASAKRTDYALVVIVEASQATEASARFPGASVLVRSGDVTADLGTVEGQIALRPVPPPVNVATSAQPPEAKAAAPIKPFREEIYFGFAKTSAARASVLRRAVRWLKANPSVHVVLEGHADPTGDHDENLALSRTRAESVRDYLIGAGIDGSRLEVLPQGDAQPKYKRDDPRNRRVVLVPKP